MANPEHALWKIVHVAGERGEVPRVSVVGTSQWGRPNAVNMVINYDSVADFEASSNDIQAEGSFLERRKGAGGRPDSIES